MSDLIKREDAIKALSEAFGECEPCDKEETIDIAVTTVKEIPSADRPQGWIPCSERLPESQGYYTCTFKDGSKYKRASAVKWSNGWQLTGTRSYWTVLAWMPLPEPWKGADDE